MHAQSVQPGDYWNARCVECVDKSGAIPRRTLRNYSGLAEGLTGDIGAYRLRHGGVDPGLGVGDTPLRATPRGERPTYGRIAAVFCVLMIGTEGNTSGETV